jgi:23S rRNA U2552 (ribose-2'-O)-methylase RlmE/FtsJ
MSLYVPIACELYKSTDIFLNDCDPKYSEEYSYAQLSNGFNTNIHDTKNKMEITTQLENKKKTYFVLNEFEKQIQNYDKSIGDISNKYFDITKKPVILSRAFYKLWELFFMFDLIPLNISEFKSVHLAEGPGSFIQATMFYRDKYIQKNFTTKNDIFHGITLHSESSTVPALEQKFTDFYNKEKPIRFKLHKTFSKSASDNSETKDNGDITNPKTIKIFTNEIIDNSEYAHLITADGGFEWINENTQEQEAFRLILAEIVVAVKIQKKDGNFVCKIYESFTNITIKLMCILNSFYEKVYVVKPLMSRKSNSEKYIVCKTYLFPEKSKNKNEMIQILDNVIQTLYDSNNENKHIYLTNFFPGYEISQVTKNRIIKINTEIANKQIININEIVSFIKSNNFYGELFNQKKNIQIEAAKYWTDLFFPKDFLNNLKIIKKQTTDTLSYYSSVSENLKNITV